MKKIINIFILGSLISYANASEIRENLYLNVNAGISTIDHSKSDLFNSVVLNNSLDSNGYNIGLALGYNYAQNYFFEINYQRVNLSDIHLDNFFLNADYRFLNSTKFTPYVGAILGYSQLVWDKDPVNSVSSINTGSNSNMYGFEVGISYPIKNRFSLEFQYQYLKFDHNTRIVKSSAMSDIKHDQLGNFNVGVRYEF